MDISSSYAKILGETNFQPGKIPEVGQKQKTEKKKKKKREKAQLKPSLINLISRLMTKRLYHTLM